jgi:hypothetical protein
MSVGHVRLRDAQASLGTPPPVGPLESAPPHRRSIAGTPQGSWRNPDPRRGHHRLRPGSEFHPLRSCRRPSCGRAPTVADRHATTRSGHKEPRRADPAETRRAWAVLRPNSLDHWLTESDEPAKYTTLAEVVQYADNRATADGDHARRNAYAAGASTRRDRHGQFRGPTPGVCLRRGSVARRLARIERRRHCQCNAMITCKTDTAASHIAGLDVPYRVIRQAGSPQATNQIPSAREDLGQGRCHPGRSDGEDGVEWRVVMPLGGEANAPM